MFQDKTRVHCALFLFIVISISFIAFSYASFSPPKHDYVRYMRQWQAVAQGYNAYMDKSNAYGPVHCFLSSLYSINFNYPRLLFVSLWLICCIGISGQMRINSHLPYVYKIILFCALFLNPLFWVFIVKYGTNDIFMAFFVLYSIFLFKRHKDSLSGLFLAIAIAIKFIPIVMVPFLFVSKGRVRWNFIFFLVGTLSIIFCASYFLWGNEIWYPFLKSHQRVSKLLSIFRFFRGEFSPLHLFVDKPNFDWASTYLIMTFILTFFFMHVKYKLEGILSSIIAVGILLTFYKVGHPQFYITLTMLIMLWISSDYKNDMESGDTLISVFTFMVWISFISFLYDLTYGYIDTNWRELFGFPNFIVSCWMLVNLIRYSLGNRYETT